MTTVALVQLDPNIPIRALVEEARASKLTRMVFLGFVVIATCAFFGRSSTTILLETLGWLLLVLADQQMTARHFRKKVEALEKEGYTVKIAVGFMRHGEGEAEPSEGLEPRS